MFQFLVAEPPVSEQSVPSIESSLITFQQLLERGIQWYHAQLNNLLIMAAVFVITCLVAFLIYFIFQRIILRLTKQIASHLPELICKKINAPICITLLLIGFSVCNNIVDFPGSSDLWINKILYAAFLLTILWGIFRIIAIFDVHFRQKLNTAAAPLNLMLLDLLRTAAIIVVWIIAVIFIAQNLFHLNVTALITGAGVIGLAIAFAAQNTIANLFGAISLISDKTFKVGDRIVSGGTDGVVEKVGFRSTRIRSLDGTIWNMPNRILADGTIQNITVRPNIKYAFTLGLVYSTTPEQMRQALALLSEILDHRPEFDAEQLPPLYFFTNFNSSSLDISVTVWFQTLDFVQCQQMKQAINLEILEKFNNAGLEFAFPTSTNYIINQGAQK